MARADGPHPIEESWRREVENWEAAGGPEWLANYEDEEWLGGEYVADES